MRTLTISLCILAAAAAGSAQRSPRNQPVPAHPQPVGDAGIAWYTTWDSGLAEAQRSNRPIFFMSAATAGRGVPGCF